MKRVVTVGAAVLDILVKSDSFSVIKSHKVSGGVAMCEVFGGKAEAQEAGLVCGGGGTNVAVGLSRLGQAVKLVTRVGDDETAAIIVKQLTQEGMDMSLVQHGKGKSGLSTVLIAKDGGRSIVTYRGESGKIDESAVDWKVLKSADWIQISSLGGESSFLFDLINFAKQNNIGVGVNPGKGELAEREGLLKLLPKIDFFSLNRMEAAVLLGEGFEEEEVMVRKMMSYGSRVVAITDGKRGASVTEKGLWLKMDAFPNKSIDDTGAGDAFVSGMVAGILDGAQPKVSLTMGLANGGSVVKYLGAKRGLLDKGGMKKWLERQRKMVEVHL